jgi:putative heme iron utilization protein
MPENKSVLRPIDDDARALARSLVRATPTASLATLDPLDGVPFGSLVTVATDLDASPLLLVSELSSHTQGLRADARCSLLLTRPGAGDPLAHPRLTLIARAEFLDRESEDGIRARRRFLGRHAKAALYADFGDFHFVRLRPQRASLNGGFGRAYEMQPSDFMGRTPVPEGFAALEAEAVAHMNDHHPEAALHYATSLLRREPGDWRLSGIDPDGVDLVDGQRVARLDVDEPMVDAQTVHGRLVALARRGRQD